MSIFKFETGISIKRSRLTESVDRLPIKSITTQWHTRNFSVCITCIVRTPKIYRDGIAYTHVRKCFLKTQSPKREKYFKFYLRSRWYASPVLLRERDKNKIPVTLGATFLRNDRAPLIDREKNRAKVVSANQLGHKLRPSQSLHILINTRKSAIPKPAIPILLLRSIVLWTRRDRYIKPPLTAAIVQAAHSCADFHLSRAMQILRALLSVAARKSSVACYISPRPSKLSGGICTCGTAALETGDTRPSELWVPIFSDREARKSVMSRARRV